MSSKKRKTLNTEKRILQYSLTAAAVLAGTSSLDAQIQTQDINKTLPNDGSSYDVQFNGIAKFRIRVTNNDHLSTTPSTPGTYIPGSTTRTYNTTTTTITTTTISGDTNQQRNPNRHTYTHTHPGTWTGGFPGSSWTVKDRSIRINNDTANAGAIYTNLNSGATIGTTGRTFNASNQLAYFYSNRGGFGSGPFLGATDKFIGVKFTDGGSTHYGWIKVTVAGDAGSITIISAAYETQADVAILSGAMPVELTSFTGALLNNSVSLKWNTATEVNNYGFEVERRAVGNQQPAVISDQWVKIGFMKGNGTSNSPKEYSFTDAVRASGTYAYRLKQVDNDGSFKYSQSIELSVVASKEFALTQNYPNPFNPLTAIGYDVPATGTVVLKVYNTLGQEVKTLVNETKEAGNYTAHFNASSLPSGQYFAKLTVGDATKTIKMTLLK